MYIRHAYIRRSRMKMAISHSGHLFAVGLFIFALCALFLEGSRAYDFTLSRQFRKNLAVSRYKNDTYWLPNYHWTAPEKYYGPRKKPAWENSEEITQQDKTKSQQEWEEKMREISRQEREKWKTYKKGTESASNRDNEEVDSSSKLEEPEQSETVSTGSQETRDYEEERSGSGSLENNEDLSDNHGEYPPSEDTASNDDDEDTGNGKFVEDHSSSIENAEPMGKLKIDISTKNNGKIDKRMERMKAMQEGRWGMDVKNPPKEYLRVISGTLEGSGEKAEKGGKGSHSRRTLSTSEVQGKGFVEQLHRKREKLAGRLNDEGETTDIFPENRWGMSGGTPPVGFLNDVARSLSSRPEEINGRADNEPFKGHGSGNLPRPEVQNRRRTKTNERKKSSRSNGESQRMDKPGTNSVTSDNFRLSLLSRKNGRDSRGKETVDLRGLFRADRWGMSVIHPPQEFLRDFTGRSRTESQSRPRQNTRWGMSASGPPKKFLEDIGDHRDRQSIDGEEHSLPETNLEIHGKIGTNMENIENNRTEQNTAQENSTIPETEEKAGRDKQEESGSGDREEYAESKNEKNEVEEKKENVENEKGRSEDRKESEGAGDVREISTEKAIGDKSDSIGNNEPEKTGDSSPQETVNEPARRSYRPTNRQSHRRGNTRRGKSALKSPKIDGEISENHKLGLTLDLPHIPAKLHSTEYRTPNHRASQPLRGEISVEERQKICANLSAYRNAQNYDLIVKMCQGMRLTSREMQEVHNISAGIGTGNIFSRRNLQSVQEKVGQWRNSLENSDAKNVYALRGISLLLRMIQQSLDPKSKFVHVPIVCRSQRIPISSFRL